MGDGNGIPITYTGSSTLFTPTKDFYLHNILCAPHIKRNLILVSKFCNQNRTSIEFFPSFFVVKELNTGAPLVRGQNRNDLYEWSTSRYQPPSALTATTKPNYYRWHQRLGHPHFRVLQDILERHSLPCLGNPNFQFCNSFNCNKSRRLPFGHISLKSSHPLEIIFVDVWGPSPILLLIRSYITLSLSITIPSIRGSTLSNLNMRSLPFSPLSNHSLKITLIKR